ncbi:(s)-ureidoglycine aminohydrolase [Quercus suber]|uniref:(S)-ureidoglycine aminohydrolase n=1 Tax=Quercus suber TaxID=58331 RepID=A0AAW0J9D4_QUESU
MVLDKSYSHLNSFWVLIARLARFHTRNLNFFDRTNTLGAYLITPAIGSNFVMYLAKMQDLQGFTRSVYKRDHALITPESQVFSPLPEWTNTLGAYLITPAIGSNFVMFIFVVQVAVSLTNISGVSHELMVDSYAYLPSNFQHSLKCNASATLVVFERSYASLEKYVTEQIVGSTKKQPLLETPGEIFEIRKLLPTSLPYDFNIHIMDFQPGEYLNVKEVHYNQHGMLLLEGQCIYRLGDSW